MKTRTVAILVIVIGSLLAVFLTRDLLLRITPPATKQAAQDQSGFCCVSKGKACQAGLTESACKKRKGATFSQTLEDCTATCVK